MTMIRKRIIPNDYKYPKWLKELLFKKPFPKPRHRGYKALS
jgi:hypothetical protein